LVRPPDGHVAEEEHAHEVMVRQGPRVVLRLARRQDRRQHRRLRLEAGRGLRGRGLAGADFTCTDSSLSAMKVKVPELTVRAPLVCRKKRSGWEGVRWTRWFIAVEGGTATWHGPRGAALRALTLLVRGS